MKKKCFYEIVFPSGMFIKFIRINDESKTKYVGSGYDIIKNKDNSSLITRFNSVEISKESLRIMEKNYRIKEITKKEFDKVSKAYKYVTKTLKI